MITLSKKLKSSHNGSSASKERGIRISIRDRLLIKEVQELESMLPSTCYIDFPDPNQLHEFDLIIVPDEGFWVGGRFLFHIFVPEEYNMAPPTVRCLTRLYHPNINEQGDICLSLLRQSSFDGMGWAPTRRLKDVIWGINSLFTDLLNFEDPLNNAAAELYVKDKEAFKKKVHEYMGHTKRKHHRH